MSDTAPPSIAAALSAVMADVQAVRKGSRNEQQGFNFRGIDAVVNAVGPALRAHGVVVLPELVDLRQGTVEVGSGDRRRPIAHVVVQVRYRFVGPAGDELATLVPGEAMDSGDKAIPKAMSVAYRAALLQALCIPTDEPDPDDGTYERAPAEPSRPQPPADMVGMVLAEAARAGVDAQTANAACAAHHDGQLLEELDRDALRAEWTHWHDAATRQSPAEKSTSPASASPAADEPRKASRSQLTMIATQLNGCGVRDREPRLAAVSKLVSRDIASMNALTTTEAHDVIEALQSILAGDDPAAALAAITAPPTPEEIS